MAISNALYIKPKKKSNPNDSLQTPPANPTNTNMFGETGQSRAPQYGNQNYIGANATNKRLQLPNARPIT
jgi:hypothetical protein